MDHILEIKGLCKYFGSTIANKNIDFVCRGAKSEDSQEKTVPVNRH